MDVKSFLLGYQAAKKGADMDEIDDILDEIDDILDEINGEVIGETLYTVTFIGDGGAELGEMSVYEQQDCANPVATGVFSEPTKPGTKYYAHPFIGWSLTDGGEVDKNALRYVTSNRTLYAVFDTVKVYLASGYCSDNSYSNVAWRIDPDYVLELSGTGSTGSYYEGSKNGDTAPWERYKTMITTLVVGEGVQSIGMYNFDGCTALTDVQLPSTLRLIAQNVFFGCTSLTSIDIPASVKFIMAMAFQGCTALSNVNFERTAAWGIYARNNSTSPVKSCTAEELADPATAAEYITNTYVIYDWTNAEAM